LCLILVKQRFSLCGILTYWEPKYPYSDVF
jgi:hypothetical protein